MADFALAKIEIDKSMQQSTYQNQNSKQYQLQTPYLKIESEMDSILNEYEQTKNEVNGFQLKTEKIVS